MHRERISSILSRSGTVDEKAKNILDVFAEPECTLTSLDLYGNNIGNEGAKALAIALQTNSTLTSLNLFSNEIGDAGAQALANALKTNTTLTSLNLRYNDMSNEGAIALAEALQTNSTLTSLDLYRNNIGHEGAIALAEALQTNSTLTSLNLGYNDIGNEGVTALAEALAEALKTNSTLTSLYLPGINIDSDTQTILFEAVLACAQKGHLIQINPEFSANQKQTIQEAYDAVILASYQRLALATALLTADTPSNSISSLNLDVLDLITEAHTNRTTPVQPDVIERYSTDRLESTQKMSLAKQCLLSMSLAVGFVVTTLAFFVTSSCRPFCLTRAGNTQHTASTELDPANAHTALRDTSNLPTPNATNNAQLASRSPRS